MRIIFLILFLISFRAESNQCLDLFSFQAAKYLPGIDIVAREELRLPNYDREQVARYHRIYIGNEGSSMAKSADLGRKVESIATAAGRSIDTVVYPNAGFDSGNAFLIFPTAKTIIATDDHPFITTQHIGLKNRLVSEYAPDFSLMDDVHLYADNRNMADMIVGNLLVAHPMLRLKRVVYVKDSAGKSHGWVEFDQGEGTALQRYVHIQHRAPDNYTSPLFIQLMEQTGFDALLAKGSMTMFNEEHGALSGFALVNYLKRKMGVVVDTDGRIWEWQRDWAFRVGDDFRKYMDITATDIHLGYDRDGDNYIYPGTKVFVYNGKTMGSFK